MPLFFIGKIKKDIDKVHTFCYTIIKEGGEKVGNKKRSKKKENATTLINLITSIINLIVALLLLKVNT